MSTQTEALESKRKYVQSLTRSKILQDLLLDEYPEHCEERTAESHTYNPTPIRLNFLIVLPATTDTALYDQIFESIKRHFPQAPHVKSWQKPKRSRITTASYY